MDRWMDAGSSTCPLNNQKHPHQIKSSYSKASPRNSSQETPNSTSSINKTLTNKTMLSTHS